MLTIDANITVGETCQITVSGSSHGGETVQVRVSDDAGHEVFVPVTLDDSGAGTANWTVANWSEVVFDYSTCTQVTRYPEQVPVA